jgi:hypothetical protein
MKLQEQILRIANLMELELKSSDEESSDIFNIDDSSNPYLSYGTDILEVAYKFEYGGYNWGAGSSGVCGVVVAVFSPRGRLPRLPCCTYAGPSLDGGGAAWAQRRRI